DRLISRGISGLVSFGIAGALSPGLRTGDLVISDRVMGEGGEAWQAHQPWLDALLGAVAERRDTGSPDDVPHPAAARRSEGHSGAAPTWLSDREDALEPARTPTVTPAVSRGPSSGQTRAAQWIPAQGRDDGRGSVRVGAILGLDRMLSSPQDK